MKPDDVKKINKGVYEYTFGDLAFRIVQILDGDKGSGVFGKWYFVNAKPADDEDDECGDHFKSKKAALLALCEYIPHRKYISPYGWCYVPDEAE